MMNKTVLIVDDNPNMSALLSEMLEIFDFKSESARNGKEALEALKKKKFSMVITDIKMPEMSGIELLGKVKEINPKMPVVMISGYSVGEFENDKNFKPDGFLSKPFLMSDIEKLLNSLL